MVLTAARLDFARIAFAAAVFILAVGPAAWLIETWRDPAFASHGFAFFLVAAALFAWSVSSPLVRAAEQGMRRRAVALLAATACVRLAGQVLAIDTIGAFALIVDVYALAHLAGLDRRARAIAPFWLAALFAFSLPLERIVQRSIGYKLQEISADGACGILSAIFHDVTCAGVRIAVAGADVLVDLPCSGARALLMFGFFFAVIAASARPRPAMAAAGATLALIAAFAGNLLRIALLASGVALGPEALGFDVMAQPWHDLIGLAALGIAAPVVIVWARVAYGRSVGLQARIVSPCNDAGLKACAPMFRPFVATAFLAAAIAIVAAPRSPVDVARREIAIAMPERVYFEQYGGAAAKATYGPFALLLVRTNAPLRHLHAPDECLRGLGFKVDYLGLRFEPLPTALYRATAPDGQIYRVETSFVSDRGHRAASVAEAVWIWLTDRGSVWTAVQRIAPENGDARASAAFESAVIAALDLPHTQLMEGARHAR